MTKIRNNKPKNNAKAPVDHLIVEQSAAVAASFEKRENRHGLIALPLFAVAASFGYTNGENILWTEQFEGTIYIYTDASYREKGDAAIAAFYGENHPLNLGQPVIVRSDSLDIPEWLGKQGTYVVFPEMINELRDIASKFPNEVIFEHVYAHNGDKGNAKADYWARETRRTGKPLFFNKKSTFSTEDVEARLSGGAGRAAAQPPQIYSYTDGSFVAGGRREMGLGIFVNNMNHQLEETRGRRAPDFAIDPIPFVPLWTQQLNTNAWIPNFAVVDGRHPVHPNYVSNRTNTPGAATFLVPSCIDTRWLSRI